jgi:hypothetical protein
MKKIFVLLAVLMFVASTASAATKAKKAKKVVKKVVVAEEFTPHWILQAQGGPALVLSSTGETTIEDEVINANTIGWAFNGSFGYALSNEFSISLLTGYETFSIKVPTALLEGSGLELGASLAYTPLQVMFQYNAPGDDVRFFGFVGAGLAFNTLTVDAKGQLLDDLISDMMDEDLTAPMVQAGVKETSFLLSPGIGMSVKLSEKADFFVQTRLDMDFLSGQVVDLLNFVTGEDAMDVNTKKIDTLQLFMPIQVGILFNI